MRRTSKHSQQGLLREEVLILRTDLGHSEAVTWRLV